jgi:ABC-type nitrate/sulfonate/bicarbonate transport system substrate-binding protein
MTMNIKQCGSFATYVLVTLLAFGGWSRAQQLPVIDVVVGNNFGHLPMFVGVEKGLFKKHGVDVRLKVVNIGSQMVTSMSTPY